MKLSENYQHCIIGIIESVQRRASGLSRGSANGGPSTLASGWSSDFTRSWRRWAELREAELCLLPCIWGSRHLALAYRSLALAGGNCFFFFFLFLSFLFLLSYLPCRWGAKAVTEASGLQCSLPPPPWDLVLIQTLRVNKNDPTYLFIYLLLLLNHSHLRVHLCLPFFLWCPGYRPYCLNCGWALPRIQQTLPLSCRDNYQPCLACHSFLWVKPW